MNKSILFVFIFMHIISTYIGKKIGNKYYLKRKIKDNKIDCIWDIAHEYLPDLHNYHRVINFIIPILLLPLYYNKSTVGLVINDLMYYFPFIIFIRSITTIVTILPKHDTCESESISWWHFLIGHCYDKIFSGHTAIVFLITLSYLRHGIISDYIMATAINLINILFILLTRSHYTIDVVISLIITYSVYNNCILNPLLI